MSRGATVEEYLATVPPSSRATFDELRSILRSVLPDAIESISYGIPVFKVNGAVVVWIAGFARHCSIYPIGTRVGEELADEIAPYVSGKGTLRFAADRRLPVALIEQVVRLRLAEGSPYRR